ncbi:MAG: hypothetical protein J0J06_01290 [Sphingomonas sp.]|uniref:hypothetical protein n=1 Tax=Sphingomonas sp. TaxID=28214 RepID=UPI001ACA6A64|nr:hypothetical protein [Sphingomonas sp.]MBN8814063.1 hypothetical protein [Sphingomonas sp.]
MHVWPLFLIAILGGCGSEQGSEPAEVIKATSFPADDLTTLLNGVRLEVPKTGNFSWNSQDVSGETLLAYLKEAKGRARIVVQIEPGTSDERVQWVRHQILAYGYCEQSLCAEAPWKAVRPVVN